jgi:C1A family cysteine protease
MTRLLTSASVLLLLLAGGLPRSVQAQGAIIETLDEVVGVPPAPAFRGTLPKFADLSGTVPTPGNQGPSGSCVSWASTYAAASQAARRAGLGSTIMLSPSFTYNKISGDTTCRNGTQTSKTLDMLRDVGALPFERYAFDAGWCGRQPTAAELQEAAKYRIKGWNKLDARQIEDVKAQLARGVPVVFAMTTNSEFRRIKGEVFDFPGKMSGGTGHAMIAVGYDDTRKAFRIQNSWGRGFGEGGYAWLGYDFWARNTEVGYVIN